jgi:hypothetical protein
VNFLLDQFDEIGLEQVSKSVVVLVNDNVMDHCVHRSNLIVSRSDVDGRSTIWVLVEHWVFIDIVFFEELVVVFTEKVKQTLGVKGQIWNHTFDSKFEINFEKDEGRRLHAYQGGDLRRS